VFHCADPYWKDEVETEVEISTESGVVTIENEGDAETGFELVLSGAGASLTLKELQQNVGFKISSHINGVYEGSTKYGRKSFYEKGGSSVFLYVTFEGTDVVTANDSGLMLFLVSTIGVFASCDGEALYEVIADSTVGALSYIEQLRKWVVLTSTKTLESTDGYTFSPHTRALGGTLSSVAYSDTLSLYCAVGGSGIIHTTTDLSTWTAQTSGVSSTLSDVIWAEGLALFIAVGASGVILTSPDGVTWTVQTSGTANALYSIFEGPVLVTVGATGTVLSSSDALTWSPVSSGTTYAIYDIMYAEGLWVFVGALGIIRSSPDLSTWTTRTSPAGRPFYSVSHSSFLDRYVITGDARYYAKTDFSAWEGGGTASLANYPLWAGAYSPSLSCYVFCGAYGLWRTTFNEGKSWTGAAPASGINSSVIWVSSLSAFFMFGVGGEVEKSTNGTTWSTLATLAHGIYRGVYVEEMGRFFVATSGGVYTSYDAVSWTLCFSSSAIVYAVGWAQGQQRIVCVDANGGIRFSEDGVHWALSNSNTTASLFDVYFSEEQNMWCASGTAVVLHSTNGLDWTVSGLSAAWYYSVVYDANEERWLTVGSNFGGYGTFCMYESLDGITWTSITPFVGSTLGRYVKVNFSNNVYAYLGRHDSVVLYTIEDEIPSLDLLSEDSSLFNLKKGTNQLRLSASGGYEGTLTYRQKYIGV
jgi:hypothetical protein